MIKPEFASATAGECTTFAYGTRTAGFTTVPLKPRRKPSLSRLQNGLHAIGARGSTPACGGHLQRSDGPLAGCQSRQASILPGDGRHNRSRPPGAGARHTADWLGDATRRTGVGEHVERESGSENRSASIRRPAVDLRLRRRRRLAGAIILPEHQPAGGHNYQAAAPSPTRRSPLLRSPLPIVTGPWCGWVRSSDCDGPKWLVWCWVHWICCGGR